MTEAKHTPGPWRLQTVETSCGLCHKIGPFPFKDGMENDACIYVDYGNNAQELLANAHLISAAPDLLLVAKFLHQLWGGDEGLEKERIACGELGTKSPVLIVHEAADAAIRKAEGRE